MGRVGCGRAGGLSYGGYSPLHMRINDESNITLVILLGGGTRAGGARSKEVISGNCPVVFYIGNITHSVVE